MRHQVIPDDGFNVPTLGVGKTLRRCAKWRSAECEGEQCGSEQAERRHWHILLVKAGFLENLNSGSIHV
jgi:hypothetical protein